MQLWGKIGTGFTSNWFFFFVFPYFSLCFHLGQPLPLNSHILCAMCATPIKYILCVITKSVKKVPTCVLLKMNISNVSICIASISTKNTGNPFGIVLLHGRLKILCAFFLVSVCAVFHVDIKVKLITAGIWKHDGFSDLLLGLWIKEMRIFDRPFLRLYGSSMLATCKTLFYLLEYKKLL